MPDRDNQADEMEQAENVRVNVFITPDAQVMMQEMGRALYPSLKRSNGVIVDQALREMYKRFCETRDQQRERR
jgi:hypothetical protein